MPTGAPFCTNHTIIFGVKTVTDEITAIIPISVLKMGFSLVKASAWYDRGSALDNVIVLHAGDYATVWLGDVDLSAWPRDHGGGAQGAGQGHGDAGVPWVWSGGTHVWIWGLGGDGAGACWWCIS